MVQSESQDYVTVWLEKERFFYLKKIGKKFIKNSKIFTLTDTGEDSKLVQRRIRSKVDANIFFRRIRATSLTQHRVENTRVHFWTFSPVSVKSKFISV